MKGEVFGCQKVSSRAFVMSGACITGDVIIKENAIVASGAQIRADECGPFYIDKGTNIQDGVVMHGLLNQFIEICGIQYSIYIGSHCSLAHCCLVHGPSHIEKKTFIGAQAQIWASFIGRNSFVGSQSLIKNSRIGQYCYIGDQAAVKGVVVPDGRCVQDFQKVFRQEDANSLPIVPKGVRKFALDFNKHVVDLNKQLVALHKANIK